VHSLSNCYESGRLLYSKGVNAESAKAGGVVFSQTLTRPVASIGGVSAELAKIGLTWTQSLDRIATLYISAAGLASVSAAAETQNVNTTNVNTYIRHVNNKRKYI
jgi:hypothetical protein